MNSYDKKKSISRIVKEKECRKSSIRLSRPGSFARYFLFVSLINQHGDFLFGRQARELKAIQVDFRCFVLDFFLFESIQDMRY